MSIRKLGKEIQTRLSAATKINSYTRAVEELVYNSLDSDSTSIAIRIDINESFIQVIDNGCGINKKDIYLLGQRYTTSKVIDLSKSAVQSNTNKYGFRGESLANVIEVSNHVKITSRYEESDETWIKYFFKGHHRDSYMTTTRPSKGTTVEMKGFLYNLHIQKKETNNISEIQSIKKFLQQVSLERTNISMSFRDNSRNEIVFTVHKNRDICQTLSSLFDIDKKDIQELQVEKNLYKIKGFVGKDEVSHISFKWININSRFVHKSAIHDIVNDCFMKSQPCNRKRSMKKTLQDDEINIKEIPFYFIFISCPKSEYDICFNPEKTLIQFNDWNQIRVLIEKFVQFFNGNVKLKEVSVKKAKSEVVGSTQEEARRIVEKILGNKNKIQMDKGITGKTVRKKSKMKNNNILKKKNSNGESNKNHKPKERSVAEVRNIHHNINSHNKINNIKTENIHKLSHAKGIKKKSEIRKDRYGPYYDPMIKKFIDPTESVKQRCDLYSENVKELLNKKTKSAQEHVRLTNIRENKKILEDNVTEILYKKKEKHSFAYSDGNTKGNSNEKSIIVPLGKTNKQYLRSYDLVKTILNTQKDVCCLENGDISSENKCRYIEQNDNCNNILNVSNCKANSASQFADFTFDSHKYLNRNNFVSKIKHRHKTTNNIYKFSIRNQITQSVCNTEFRHSELKKYSLKKNCDETRRENINKVPCTKLDNVLNIDAQEFYNIDINYNYKSDITKAQNKYFNDSNRFNTSNLKVQVTGNIQSTYTVVDSNVSSNFEQYINHEGTIRECYEKSMAIEEDDKFREFSFCKKDSTREHIYDHYSREINKACVSNNLFTSYSENVYSEMITNSHIDPLNVCEAIYNHFESNNYIDNTSTLSTTKDSKNICPNSRTISETSGKVNYDDILRHDVNDQSSQFQSVNNINLPSNIVQNQDEGNNQNEKTGKNEIEISSITNNSNEKYVSESLDLYFKTSQDWADIVTENQNSNNFIIQSRHKFLPKGMSQIFEKCNSKKICSHNLKMDYFHDELYKEFANNVLDNFNLFETRIQNAKDYVPENSTNLNKKLKTDSTSLKFNAPSLASAKVYGQVDNKFIAAELHCDNDNSLKYLVLFDQHAVHERITLEEILSDYIKDDQWISVECETLAIKLNKENFIYLNNYKDKFTQLGLRWLFENDIVLFNGMPKAVLGKHFRQPDVILTSIKKLINEEIKAIKSLKGNSLLYPKSIMDLVFSEV